jgi:hypothetical protein
MHFLTNNTLHCLFGLSHGFISRLPIANSLLIVVDLLLAIANLLLVIVDSHGPYEFTGWLCRFLQIVLRQMM